MVNQPWLDTIKPNPNPLKPLKASKTTLPMNNCVSSPQRVQKKPLSSVLNFWKTFENQHIFSSRALYQLASD